MHGKVPPNPILTKFELFWYKNEFGPNLGWSGTTKNHLKGFLKEPKWPNRFPKPLPLNVFTLINLFIFHVYPLHALIYGLKFILEFKNENC